MSTILKALRRLEEEKTTVSEGRPLREEVASRAPAPAEPGGLRRWAPAAGALLLGLAAGGLVFWAVSALLTDGVGEESATVATREAPPAPAPERPPPEPATTGAAPAGPPDDAYASDVEVVRRRELAPRAIDGEPVPPRREERPGARRPVESSSAAARAREMAEMRRRVEATLAQRGSSPGADPAPTPSRSASATAPAPAPAEESASSGPSSVASPPAPEPSVGTGADADAGAPSVSPEPREVASRTPSAPAEPEPAPAREPMETAAAPSSAPGEPAPERVVQTGDAGGPVGSTARAESPEVVPSPTPQAAPEVALAVQRTEWHPVADRRRAWVVVDAAEPRAVVEGEVVGGMVVSKIEPSGVVFERDGESLRRAVGAAAD